MVLYPVATALTLVQGADPPELPGFFIDMNAESFYIHSFYVL
ncbi:MAG: hypothetical protein P8X55_12770 [Desulfosarcinaceae bacterium]|jgi:hypothetical protein